MDTKPTAAKTYHCQAHGAGAFAATQTRVSREEAGRWVREEMAREIYRTITIKGVDGVAVRLVNDREYGWMTTEGRVSGVQTSDEVSALAA